MNTHKTNEPGGSSYQGTGSQGSRTFRRSISPYGASTDFFGRIMVACFKGVSKKKILLLDAMAGPGELGKDLKAKFEESGASQALAVVFNDVRQEPLSLLEQQGHETLLADIRFLQTAKKFDIVAVRYGLNDLIPVQIVKALSSIFDSIVNGGRVVIADMFAPTKEGQESIRAFHAEKQRFAGRDVAKEGECYIPTIAEWMDFLQQAGFTRATLHFEGTSDVDTQNWKGQFPSDSKEFILITYLNVFASVLADKNPAFARDLQLKFTDMQPPFSAAKLEIKFPIMVLSAEKPPPVPPAQLIIPL